MTNQFGESSAIFSSACPTDMTRNRQLDGEDKAALRTHLRLVLTFLRRGEGIPHGSYFVEFLEPVTVPFVTDTEGLSGWKVRITMQGRESPVRNLPVSECITHIELGLLSEACKAYTYKHWRAGPSVRADFDRLSHLEQVKYINHAYRPRGDAFGCNDDGRDPTTDYESSPLIAPDIENQAVDNLLSIARMPAPGLLLLRHRLTEQLPGGLWSASMPTGEGRGADQDVILQQTGVFRLCEEFVHHIARGMYFEANGLDSQELRVGGNQPGFRKWQWLPFGEQHAWIAKALQSMSQDAQDDHMQDFATPRTQRGN